MFKIVDGSLDVVKLYEECFKSYKHKNYGAFLSFCGIVRAEDNIKALSFDIYEKLLLSWFSQWQKKVEKEGILLCFAHSKGNVYLHESSFFAAVFSKNRKEGLITLNDFVEDFKANAPIWKYDFIGEEKIYAKNRSIKLKNAGLLGKKC